MNPGSVDLMNAAYPVFAQNSIVPDNPAAQQFGAPSRAAYGLVRGKSQDDVNGKIKDLQVEYLGFRLAVQRISLGYARTAIRADYPAALNREINQAMAFSFSFPEWLAFGYGANIVKKTIGLNEYLVLGNRLGASWRIGENFFVGGATGTETARLTLVGKGDRMVTTTGAAFRKGGTLAIHAEYDITSAGYFEDSAGAQFQPLDFFGYSMHQATIELSFMDWMAGYSLVRGQSEAGAGNLSLRSTTADFGYAPFVGFAITGHYEFSQKRNNSTVLAQDALKSINVAIQF